MRVCVQCGQRAGGASDFCCVRGLVGPHSFLGISGPLENEARGWLLDCFPDNEGEIHELDAAGLVAAVNRHYEGGWRAFLAADPEYADIDEAGQLSIGVTGEQRAIPGLAAAIQWQNDHAKED